MIWFEFTATDGAKHIINSSHIIDVHYEADADMTAIVMDRAGYSPIFIHGNKATEISKIITKSEKFTSYRVGE